MVNSERQYYTLRVTVTLIRDQPYELEDAVCGLRTQELTGDLGELCMMGGAVPAIADGMTLAVLGAERRRQAVQE